MITTIVFGAALFLSIIWIDMTVARIINKVPTITAEIILLVLSVALWSWLWYLCH